MKHLFCIGFGLLLGTACVVAQEQTNISPRAESVLRSACDFLAKTPAFSFSGEIWREHVNDAGQKVQFSRTVQMDVKRPNGLRVEINSPFSTRGFWYDGKTLTILDQTHNWYSAAAMPSVLDAALDTARDKYGIDLPLIDLAVSDPYKDATAKVQTGRYYGISPVLGVPCHHLAFTQENVDWQIWIEEGPQPLIRKFVITYKNESGAPEFTALITHWNMTDRIDDSDFIFAPPKEASKIEMRADEQSGGTNAASPNEK